MTYTVIDPPTKKQPCKSNWRPTYQEGLYIQYRLKQVSSSLANVGANLTIGTDTISRVVFGQRRSRRIEAEIARILGKESWDDVVIEARLAVSDPAYTPSREAIAAYKSAHSDCEQSGNEEEE
jgi:hypothetical protein